MDGDDERRRKILGDNFNPVEVRNRLLGLNPRRLRGNRAGLLYNFFIGSMGTLNPEKLGFINRRLFANNDGIIPRRLVEQVNPEITDAEVNEIVNAVIEVLAERSPDNPRQTFVTVKNRVELVCNLLTGILQNPSEILERAIFNCKDITHPSCFIDDDRLIVMITRVLGVLEEDKGLL